VFGSGMFDYRGKALGLAFQLRGYCCPNMLKIITNYNTPAYYAKRALQPA